MDLTKQPRPNTEIEKVACDLAVIYEGVDPTIVTTIAVCILYWYQNTSNMSDIITYPSDEDMLAIYGVCVILCMTLILIFFVMSTKNIFKTSRPCQTIGIQTTHCCPDNYDIPSGHTALGIFHGLVLYSAGYDYLSILFFIQPILRYVGKQHSLTAITVGGIYGIIFYLIFAFFFNRHWS